MASKINMMCKHRICKEQDEPVALKAPSFSSESKSFTFEKRLGLGFALLCPAQAQPVPKFRSVFVVYGFFPKTRGTFQYSEPVGSKAPSFSSDSKISSFERKNGQSFALLCSAQAQPAPVFRLVPFLNLKDPNNQPQTSVVPTAKDKTISGLKISFNTGRMMALLCAAQGFPAPLHR
ncbi:hypothetical protein HHI36_009359 [Cryptolaemus montrouzieri]|uniref:Uncharacterized protein n=1 Tax=Cryptolaemus montrouzieri TaxID=559131 RepID=A0ABD2MV38_9CUCU